ncbi:HAD family hydrolase [Pseudomonas fluorescens]|uniref:HAD family hydrolase n=1 Tax=Pseudomonas fluorescens TaxID=294 RepID=UPI001930CE1B|nr:HAD family hydrolase [Pseudomonas fluorescens]MBD8089381.1 HAD family hydrolase [Pseudomonas fluorescens]
MNEPEKTAKKLLVLDLDECLLYAEKRPFENWQYLVKDLYVTIRPGVEAMLDAVAPHYDFIVWSNTDPAYVYAKLDAFWPQRHPILDVYSSLQCKLKVEGGYGLPFYKDLKKIIKHHPQYQLAQIIALDDKPAVYKDFYGNFLLAHEFKGDLNDRHLERVTKFLVHIADEPNVRKIEKRWFKLDQQKWGLDDHTPGLD